MHRELDAGGRVVYRHAPLRKHVALESGGGHQLLQHNKQSATRPAGKAHVISGGRRAVLHEVGDGAALDGEAAVRPRASTGRQQRHRGGAAAAASV